MAAPNVQNQNPAPASSGKRGDGAIYLEVVDADGNLAASTVQIWANGVLAWSGLSAGDGWSGSRVVVVNGYGYTGTPGVPLPAQSTVTIRVRAEDLDGNVLDTSYTFSTSSFLDTVAPLVIPTSGGGLIVAVGLFTRAPLAAHLGPLGTIVDPPCYGGSNRGYAPRSDDGVTVQFAAPPLAKGAVGLTVVDGVITLGPEALDVVERNWPHKVFDCRRRFPPWAGVGDRNLEFEDLE